MLYADTSALTKLVLPEAESAALRVYLDDHPRMTSSTLALTELIRAVCRVRLEAEQEARGLLDTLVLVEVSEAVLTAAASVAPPELRTLDAIHIATALTLGNELEAVLTYDQRMIEAARATGLDVVSPA